MVSDRDGGLLVLDPTDALMGCPPPCPADRRRRRQRCGPGPAHSPRCVGTQPRAPRRQQRRWCRERPRSTDAPGQLGAMPRRKRFKGRLIQASDVTGCLGRPLRWASATLGSLLRPQANRRVCASPADASPRCALRVDVPAPPRPSTRVDLDRQEDSIRPPAPRPASQRTRPPVPG